MNSVAAKLRDQIDILHRELDDQFALVDRLRERLEQAERQWWVNQHRADDQQHRAEQAEREREEARDAWRVLAAHPDLPEPIRAMMRRRLATWEQE